MMSSLVERYLKASQCCGIKEAERTKLILSVGRAIDQAAVLSIVQTVSRVIDGAVRVRVGSVVVIIVNVADVVEAAGLRRSPSLSGECREQHSQEECSYCGLHR